MNDTLSWYEENAESYVSNTKDSLVPDALREFLSRVREGGRILDYGCGSGRDSYFFLKRNYKVDSLDGSERMAEEAARTFGLVVEVAPFLSLNKESVYDGIWAQASILHLRPRDLDIVLDKIYRALKDGGVFYSSFRKGEEDGWEEGRYYTNMSLERYKALLPPGLELIKAWEGEDVRKGVQKTWLSFLSIKKSQGR